MTDDDEYECDDYDDGNHDEVDDDEDDYDDDDSEDDEDEDDVYFKDIIIIMHSTALQNNYPISTYTSSHDYPFLPSLPTVCAISYRMVGRLSIKHV